VVQESVVFLVLLVILLVMVLQVIVMDANVLHQILAIVEIAVQVMLIKIVVVMMFIGIIVADYFKIDFKIVHLLNIVILLITLVKQHISVGMEQLQEVKHVMIIILLMEMGVHTLVL
jgi:hypothetical protein